MATDVKADDPPTLTAIRLHELLRQTGEQLRASLDSLDEALLARFK